MGISQLAALLAASVEKPGTEEWAWKVEEHFAC